MIQEGFTLEQFEECLYVAAFLPDGSSYANKSSCYEGLYLRKLGDLYKIMDKTYKNLRTSRFELHKHAYRHGDKSENNIYKSGIEGGHFREIDPIDMDFDEYLECIAKACCDLGYIYFENNMKERALFWIEAASEFGSKEAEHLLSKYKNMES